MSIQEKIDQYSAEINQFTAAGPEDAEAFRLKFLVNKGIVRSLFEEFKTVSVEEKRVLGQVLNQFKQLAESKHKDMLEQLSEKEGATAGNEKDLTLPGNGFTLGSRHPLSLVRKEIIEIFKKQGFIVAEGPEIEDDWHNFSALNFPEEHPARDMQDTFFIEKKDGNDIALRTHTSSVQVRMMEMGKPPFRAIMPGRVYRNEAISARAHCFFHQVEACMWMKMYPSPT